MFALCLILLIPLTPPPSERPSSPPAEPTLLRPEHYDLEIAVDFEAETLTGTARLRLSNPSDTRVAEASFLLYRLMTVHEVRDESGRSVEFQQDVVPFEDAPKRQVNHIVVPLAEPLAPGDSLTLSLSYGGHLLGYAETETRYVRETVDPAYTLIREDAAAYPTVRYPSYRVNRAAGLPPFTYRARISAPATHVVANGGRLVDRTEKDGTATSTYESIRPSWRMDFAVAPFTVLERGPLRIFHFPEDSTGAARVMGSMERGLALLTDWFGPRRGTATFTVIEIPDGWGSQADVTSILQSAAAFRDADRTTEVYHELSHLWNPPSTDAPSPRWNEGLATYLQEAVAERLDGAPGPEHLADDVAGWLASRIDRDPRLREVPFREYGLHEMTDYSYSVGMVFFTLVRQIAGETALLDAYRTYYQQTADTGGSTEQLLETLKAGSAEELDPLIHDWVTSTDWVDALVETPSLKNLTDRYRRTR